MKGHNKLWSIVGFVLVVLAILAGTYVSVIGVGAKHQGSAKNIKLGLDLAGGVSITYEVNESNPSAEDMRDTVYKLQQRVSVTQRSTGGLSGRLQQDQCGDPRRL